jgi:hypothetical protein
MLTREQAILENRNKRVFSIRELEEAYISMTRPFLRACLHRRWGLFTSALLELGAGS